MKKSLLEMCGPNRCYKTLIQFVGTLGLAMALTGCAGNQYERSTGESVDDTATTGRVKRALGTDTIYRYPNVKVTTFKGNVQLSGFVDTTAQKDKAGDLAKATPGVKDVENRITVR
jgi:osmotically-inducible protein OsmY